MTAKDDAVKATIRAREKRIGEHIDARNAGMIEGLGCAATIARGLGQPGVAAAIVAEMVHLFPKLAKDEIERRKL